MPGKDGAMDMPSSFGYWVRRRRKALDLTQGELARRVGCAEVTIQKIEADERRPSSQIAALLAEHLRIPLNEQSTFLQRARGELAVDQLPTSTPDGGHIPSSPAMAATDAPAVRPPSGTVTFLFTDIEASTQLWEQHPQAMRVALARHDAILVEVITAHRGVIVKATGDGVHAVFARGTDALAAALAAQCAIQAQAWEAVGCLRIRMAVHTGVSEERDGDYFGLALNRAARLLAAGHGGQILLSRASVEVVQDHLPGAVVLRDLGIHQLKDITRPEHIFQVVASDLPSDFPPLRCAAVQPHNLPVELTSFVGRTRELATIASMLADAHLLTLTGPGGTGKTRLARQAAAELLDDFQDGVFFVNLAPISAPELVAGAIAQTVGVRETAGRPLLDGLYDYLRDKHMLLLLDNFEQVSPAAPVIAELLAAAPRRKVLVTSRAVLHLYGEREFAVPPLGLPPHPPTPSPTPGRGGAGDAGGLTQYEAGRGGAGDAGGLTQYEAGREGTGDAGGLTQYEAVRLFIERAQAVKADFVITNTNASAVAEICYRLDGLPLAIELAAARVKLLAPQALLERLERRLPLLTGGPQNLPARQQTLRATLDWSYELLDADEQVLFARLAVFVGGCTIEAAESICADREPRIEDGGWKMEDRSAIFYPPSSILDGLAALVDKSLLRQVEGPGGAPRFVMLETIREYALERLEMSGEAAALRRQHAAYYLVLAERAEPLLHGAEQVAWLNRLEADYDNLRAVLAWLHGEQTTARALHAESLALFRELGERWPIALSLRALGDDELYLNACERAVPLLEESLQLFRELGDQFWYGDALLCLGYAARLQGDDARAAACYAESLALFRDLRHVWGIAGTQLALGWLAQAQGDAPRAAACFAESLVRYQELGHREGISLCLAGSAGAAGSLGQPVRAAQLFGAAEGLRVRIGALAQPIERAVYAESVASVRAQLNQATFAAAWAEGRALTMEQAIAEALTSL